MQFEQWWAYARVGRVVIVGKGERCDICGADFANSRYKDITTVETHSRFRDSDIKFSICWDCQEVYMETSKIQELLARAVQSMYWRSQRVNVRKKIFLMKMLQAMYQRGRDEVRAMEEKKRSVDLHHI